MRKMVRRGRSERMSPPRKSVLSQGVLQNLQDHALVFPHLRKTGKKTVNESAPPLCAPSARTKAPHSVKGGQDGGATDSCEDALTHHVLQRGGSKHLEHRVGFGGRDAEDDGLLPHSGGVLIKRRSQLPTHTHTQRKTHTYIHTHTHTQNASILDERGFEVKH